MDYTINLAGVPENFSSVVINEFYNIAQTQEGFDSDNTETLSTGEVDPIAMLYSTSNIPAYPETITGVNDGNAYNITFSGPDGYEGFQDETFYFTVPIAIPGVISSYLAADAGDLMKIQLGDSNEFTYRAIVRSVLIKMPGMYMTNYESYYLALLATTYGIPAIVSMEAIKLILENEWTKYPSRETAFNEAIADY